MTPERARLVAAKQRAEHAHVFRANMTDGDEWARTLVAFYDASQALQRYDAQHKGEEDGE